MRMDGIKASFHCMSLAVLGSQSHAIEVADGGQKQRCGVQKSSKVTACLIAGCCPCLRSQLARLVEWSASGLHAKPAGLAGVHVVAGYERVNGCDK